jgi:glycosyltransferase involved in cell wall biosynthesis
MIGKHLYKLVLFCLFCCGSVFAELEQKPMVVVIPSYNNKNWYQRNLDSVFLQKYENYRVIFVDDSSPDCTGLFVKSYIKQLGQEGRVTLVQNEKRNGALANIYKAVHLCAPEEIIVTLDGDDWFFDDQVLAKLNEVYSDLDVWMTYGQFVHYPCGSPGWASELPAHVIDSNGFRNYNWVTTHLRTFYAGLFHKIKKDDLLLEGAFFPMAWDLAFMFPMLEMAGFHSRFIPDVLYVYNIATPFNDIKVDPTYQQNLGWLIRTREKYAPLSSSPYPLRDAPSH